MLLVSYGMTYLTDIVFLVENDNMVTPPIVAMWL